MPRRYSRHDFMVVPFEMGISEKPALLASTAKATKINPAHTISLRQTGCRKTGETITAAVYEYLVDYDGEWGELGLTLKAAQRRS